MKQYLKVLSVLVLLGSVVHAGWDQSTDRWERDCNAGDSTACYFAAMGYEKGELTVWNGQNNETKSCKKNYVKAASLYKKGCDLGDNHSCVSYQKLKNKVPKNMSTSSGTKKNYKITHKGSKTTYTIVGKKKCSLYFDKNKKLQKSTCKKIVNSKGIKIYCSPLKKACKTEQEIKEAI